MLPRPTASVLVEVLTGIHFRVHIALHPKQGDIICGF
jgi:hypothetical protein